MCATPCPNGALSLSDEVFAVDLLKGVVETYEMRSIAHPHGTSQSILHSLKGMLTTDQVYEP